MAISLRLVRRLVAKGVLTATDGYKPCTREARVKVQRRAGRRWSNIKTVTTNNLGKYRAKVPNKPGRYRVVSPKWKAGDLHRCSAARSRVRRAR